jgi:hypothetical protein
VAAGAQEEDLGIGEEMRFELARSKTVSGIAGLGAAMEKPSGPHAASVARNVRTPSALNAQAHDQA